MSKLHSSGVVPQHRDPPQLQILTPLAPEMQPGDGCSPPRYKQPPVSDAEEEEGFEEDEEDDDEQEQWMSNRVEAQHFNNTTYFFIQKE